MKHLGQMRQTGRMNKTFDSLAAAALFHDFHGSQGFSLQLYDSQTFKI